MSSCSFPRSSPLISVPGLLLCSVLLACTCMASASTVAVSVNPTFGANLPTCSVSSPCKTIAYAVQQIRASFVYLSPGIFNESAVGINSSASLVISGSPAATFFDCSQRMGAAIAGAAFNILNSSVTITGITFQNCANVNARGGAVSASGSSVVVSNCSFVNCSAASGGAVSVTGPGGGLSLSVQNSTFASNSATGSCPADATQPCSSWGGAIAAFEMPNVTVVGCTMVRNNAQASVPPSSLQASASSNAVAGGGCVSLVYSGNASGCSVRIDDNTFFQCTVTVPGSNGVKIGNGMRGAWVVACTVHLQRCFVSRVCRIWRSCISQRWPVRWTAAA